MKPSRQSAAWKTHYRKVFEPGRTGCGMSTHKNPSLKVIDIWKEEPTCRRCFKAFRRTVTV